MKRVISLYLPTWPTDRLRRSLGNSAPPADTPTAMIGREGQKRVVTSVNAAAKHRGLKVGMMASQASAIVAGLYTADADPAEDRNGLERVAQWALKRYSPIIAADYPDGLYIDASGCAHLFGNEQAMLVDLTLKLKEQGIEAKATMAPSYGAAHAAARFSARELSVIASKNLAAAVHSLPVAALRIPYDKVQALNLLGFETIGELNSKPRAPLALRFGQELIKRLDQVYSRADEVFTLSVLPDLIHTHKVFAEPISNPETIAKYIRSLVEALCNILEVQVSGARSLDLIFHRVDSSLQNIRIGLAKPARDAKRLSKLLIDKLETIDPGFGIEAMRLLAPWTETLAYQQIANELGDKAKPDIASLVDTLANRLGPERVYQTTPLESDVPERSVSRGFPLQETKPNAWPHKWPRPTRLLKQPESIETIAMLPDYPPVSFVWRGRRHKVRAADGPERIFGEWWKRDAEFEAVRDYFQLENEAGERFWVFRSGDGILPNSGNLSWFMHGLFG